MKALFFFITMSISFQGIGQLYDTLYYAEGKISSAITNEPITARITYQSLPYGNRVGFQSGSSFSFPLFDKEKYSITIEAPGFAPSKYMLDPAEANNERKVIKDIVLGLPASAAQIAESTHTVGKLMRLDNLIFEAGSAKIENTSYAELNDVVSMMQKNPKMIIQLEGHTDYAGSAKLNMKLSEDRVTSVKNYLTTQGINKNRIKTKAFGGTEPLSREDNEEARRLNRRVELRILQN